MKHSLLYFICIVSYLTVLSACSSSSEQNVKEPTQDKIAALNQLKADLESIDLSVYGVDNTKSIIGDIFTVFGTTVLSDALSGALTLFLSANPGAALTAGISASVLQAFTSAEYLYNQSAGTGNNSATGTDHPELGYDEDGNQLEYDDEGWTDEDVDILVDEDDEVMWDESFMDNSLNLGLWHNQIIRDLYQSYGNQLFKLPADSLYLVVQQKVALHFSDVPAMDSTTVNLINSITSSDLQGLSADDYYETLEENVPLAATEIQTIRPVITNLTLIERGENKVAYMNTAITMVDNANISNSTKDILKVGITIATGSSQLWDFDGLEQIESE